MLYRNRTKQEKRRTVISVVCTLVTIVVLFLSGNFFMKSINQDISEQALASVKSTVMKSAVQCYAVEGSYPQSLSYLEENYGLQLNHTRYIVTYDVFASNVLPEVMVLQR